MAATIFHGPPGSYKSSSAVWYELLPALRSGRLVVTNIEGIQDIETIQIELGEEFPEGADIWRLSSQTDKGKWLWMRWFWWMPVGAFIILDEVQDVFPNDSTVFKPIELDSTGIKSIQDKLPEKYFNYYLKAIDAFTVPDDYQDDTGEKILDEDGFIIYPVTMREANMRHRKYNWDIIYCTPEITEIHKLVRSVCQYAYKHNYREFLEVIPYFKRRTRINEHSPKSNGETIRKGDTIKWRKLPIEVFKLYKSTSTDKITVRGGLNAFKDPSLIFSMAILVCCFSYFIWWGLIKDDGRQAEEVTNTTFQENRSVVGQSSSSAAAAFRPAYDIQNNNESNVPLGLPYDAQKIYFTGYLDVVLNRDKKYKEYFFTLVDGQNEISINSTDLQYFGIKIHFINECAVRLSSGKRQRVVYCTPKTIPKPVKKNPSNERDISLFSD